MTHSDSKPDRNLSDELAVLRAIVEGTARQTGQEFLHSLVRHLAAAVGAHYAFVAVFAGDTRARTLAFWSRDRITDNVEWDVIGTPCEDVIRGNLCHYPSGVSQRFPGDKLSVGLSIESYLGVPLLDTQGRHLGHLAVFDERAMPAEPRDLFTFRIFAARAVAELERLQYEERLRESEQRSRSLTEELRQVNARLELAMSGSNIAIWDIDMPDGDFRHGRRYYVNIWERLGYERPDFPPDQETSMALVHPDDRAVVEEAARKYLAGETSRYEVENRVRHKNGSYRWMLARGVAVRDAGGKPIRFLGSGIDITDLKRAEQALRESEAELRRVNDRLELAVRGSN